MLGGVIANHLFLSQFELFRACLLTLSVRSPRLARDIYQTVIKKIWTLKGVVWSESVPSSAHMAWLCLQELHAMEEKLADSESTKPEGDGDGDGSEQGEHRIYCRPVYDSIEFLLLLEFLNRYVVDHGNSIAKDITAEECTGTRMLLLSHVLILDVGVNVGHSNLRVIQSSSSGKSTLMWPVGHSIFE